MHVLGSCKAFAQYSPINFFVNLFHSKNSNLHHCFSDLIHTEYRKSHKDNGHSPFFLPPIMRSSVGQCRNIRFRQLYASHVIIISAYVIDKSQIGNISAAYGGPQAACHTRSKAFLKSTKTDFVDLGGYFSHRILMLKVCYVVLFPVLNLACSSAIIYSAWG